MFKLLFSAIAGGGPMEWAALALGAALLLGGAFTGGVLYESGHVATAQAEVLASTAAKAAKAQHDQDQQAITDAKAASDAATARHDAGDTIAAKVAAALKALPRVTVSAPPANDPHACDYSTDALKALNDAGHQ